MSDNIEGRKRKDADRSVPRIVRGGGDLDRLEEIGDLHFEASAFSSALEYYQRLLDAARYDLIDPARSLGILRKSIDAALNLGDHALAEGLLARASDFAGPDSDLDSEDRMMLLAPIMGRRAGLLANRSSYAKALQLAKHAFAVLAITDDHKEVANLQVTMGVCHQRLGRPGKAEEFYTDALATFRRIGDELGTAILYNNLALLQKNSCRWDRALQLQEKAVAVARRHGATHLLSRLYLNEGIILRKTGRLGEARASLEKCLRLSRSLGDIARQTKASLALGYLELEEGHQARAEEMIIAGKTLAEEGGFVREATIADEYLGDILLSRGEIDKALYNYQLGLRKTQVIGKVTDLEGELLRRSAEAYRLRGEIDEAISTGQAAVAVCESCGEEYELGFCFRTLGQAFTEAGEFSEADRYFRDSIGQFRQQNLQAEISRSVLAFLEARLPSAGRSELLLLRRYLVEAIERRVSDDALLRGLHRGLAEIQLRLGQFEEALLTVAELDRLSVGGSVGAEEDEVAVLRQRIEKRLAGDLSSAKEHMEAMTAVPGLVEGEEIAAQSLASILKSGLAKTGGDSGFLALRRADSRIEVIAAEGVSGGSAASLAGWYSDRSGHDDPVAPLVMTRIEPDSELAVAIPALADLADSCVFLPVTHEGVDYGVLFLAKRNSSGARASFSRASLEFLTAYLGFLGVFLAAVPGRRSNASPIPIEERECFENIITGDELMLELLGLIRKVAPSELTVLLHGETGTGKGLLAYAIHALSSRKDDRFLAVNCAAIPESLLESELFGHVRGSFTGAVADKAGLLVEAEGGTLFLDEIGKMPLAMQGKLLHFLDTKVVRPVGSNIERRVDVRIICATKGDLQEMATRGDFLEDLYYRLLDFPLRVPPLRERPEDIRLLVQHFIARFAAELGRSVPGFTSAVAAALQNYLWPGNVRELEKCLRRAIVLSQDDDMLRLSHLPAEIAGVGVESGDPARVAPLRETLSAVESREIAAALRASGGNKSEAGRMLGISYPSLLRKIRLYGITSD